MIQVDHFSSKRLGSALKYMRMARGLSLRDLAKLCGVSAAHICRMEAGEWIIQLDTFIKVAMPLNVPCGLLLEEGLQLLPWPFLQAIKEDDSLSGLMNSPKSLTKETKADRRAKILLFLANLAIAANYLCLSSDPIGTAGRIDLPLIDLMVPFKKLAEELARSEYTARSIDFTEALQVEPVTFLIQTNLVSPAIIEAYLKMIKQNKGQSWDPTPKFI